MGKSLITAYRPERYTSEARTYVVLGAPRGGTSMLAGALQLLGVPMGSVNNQHEDPAFHDESKIDGMIEAIAERNRNYGYWGWKLPNTIYFYDRLAEHLRNPVFLVIYRNPFDIFRSAASKSNDQTLTDPHFNAPVYHYAKMHQLIHERPEVPTFLMSYEACCASPERFAVSLSAILPFEPNERNLERAIRFVNPSRGYKRVRSPLSRLLGWVR